MSVTGQQPRVRDTGTAAAKITGEAVYLYAFDIAYEIPRAPLRELLGQPVAQFIPDATKKSPRQLFFYRPQMVRLPPIERFGPRGPIRVERSIKLLPVGAISVMVRIPFSVDKIEDLVGYHDIRFTDGSYLYDEVRDLAEQVRQELAPGLIRPVKTLGDEEAYTVFCFNAPLRDAQGNALSAEDWFLGNRRAVASLLTEEPDLQQLSDQEADESSAKYFSYYENDIVVIDWDAAVVVDDPRSFDETLYIIELANVQLAELEAYDRILDDAVETSYRDLAGKRFKSLRLSSTQRELREIRIDLARLQDELGNITKFFGDWHLARIYQGLATRFHLQEWQKSIDEKLRTLDDLYQIMRQDQMNMWMLILEASIVALFILDIVKSIF
ncbi:MAG TPA: hypothetical protein PLD59_01190 [Tepidisphaeraceae bacterium]|nr:hypothetical protein [Tepidisphaeraceae bacterium]